MKHSNLMPVLLGVPGAGKSTLSEAYAALLGMSVFHSDVLFRECRSLPQASSDPRRAIFSAFLERVARDHPGHLEAVANDAEAIDGFGQCVLRDGQRFRREHGEHVFRAFEIEMLQWAYRAGLLNGRVPDLSSTAPLYDDNRALFSPDHGFLPILLKLPDRVVISRVLADYEVYRAASGAGDNLAIRGQYEAAFDAIYPRFDDPAERAGALWQEAERLTRSAIADRNTIYQAYAALEFAPDPLRTARHNAIDLMLEIADFI